MAARVLSIKSEGVLEINGNICISALLMNLPKVVVNTRLRVWDRTLSFSLLFSNQDVVELGSKLLGKSVFCVTQQ